MAIKKQEFYEGAAIHRLVCFGGLKSVSFKAPFFLLNARVSAYLKYSTKTHSPWGFTFTPNERLLLEATAKDAEVIIGLICGSDGVALVRVEEILELGLSKDSATRISCFRKYGKHYKICGPDGQLSKKVAPSDWTKLLGAV